MGDYLGPVIEMRTGVTGSEADPSLSTDGFETGKGVQEYVFFLEGGTDCTANVWWYSGSAWCKGPDQTVTGSQPLLAFALGERMDIKLTGITGTYAIRRQQVDKDA